MTHEHMNISTYEWMCIRICGSMDGRIYKSMDGWVDVWMDGSDLSIYLSCEAVEGAVSGLLAMAV